MLKARVARVDVIPHLLSRNVPSLVMRPSNFHGQEKEKCNFLNSDVLSFQLPGLCARASCSCAWITRLSRLKSCSNTLLWAPTYIPQWPLLAFMSRQKWIHPDWPPTSPSAYYAEHHKPTPSTLWLATAFLLSTCGDSRDSASKWSMNAIRAIWLYQLVNWNLLHWVYTLLACPFSPLVLKSMSRSFRCFGTIYTSFTAWFMAQQSLFAVLVAVTSVCCFRCQSNKCRQDVPDYFRAGQHVFPLAETPSRGVDKKRNSGIHAATFGSCSSQTANRCQ